MADVILEQLRAAAGDVRAAAAEDAVDGVPARWVARPAGTAETSALLRAATAHDLAVVVRGSGSKLSWGAPPERVDLVLDTGRMDAVVEHAAGDLIAVVQAGCPLAALQEQLAGAGQWLAVDPARSGTVGGAVATASTGPARLLHGAVRDLLIGMTMVRADGVVAHSGGKVVKNVAGYDVGKLLTGSYGTLGVITEVAFRLHPVPEARAWVSVTLDSAAAVHEAVQRVVHSQLVPSAVELDRPGTGAATLTLLLEGIGPGVKGRSDQAVDLLGHGAQTVGEPPAWWGAEPFGAGDVALKLTHEIAGLPHLLVALDTEAAASGLHLHLRGSAAVGTALAGVRAAGGGPADPAAVGAFIRALRERTASFGGSVVLLDAPRPVKEAVGDVWGPVGGFDLMRSVKHRFDPARLLSPGRFVGGI